MSSAILNIAEEGRKIWEDIHNKAWAANTEEEKIVFDRYIQNLQQNFGCLDCQEHFGKYLSEFPPAKHPKVFSERGRDITYFHWSWLFHDQVNKRLGKKRFTFEQTYTWYQQNYNRMETQKMATALKLLEEYRKGTVKGRKI